MKTYRTIDLLKAVYDGKIFKNKFRNVKTGEMIYQGEGIEGGYKTQFYYVRGINFIPCSLNSSSFRSVFNEFLEEEWEEVQEPVSFTEAIKASYGGKTIYCILEQEKYVYPPLINEFSTLIDGEHDGLSVAEILCGKWYIKEDEE